MLSHGVTLLTPSFCRAVCEQNPRTHTRTMLACQHDYVAKMKQGRTPEATEAARQLDQASHARLNKLRSLAHNSTCFDCSAMKPGWVRLHDPLHVGKQTCAAVAKHASPHRV